MVQNSKTGENRNAGVFTEGCKEKAPSDSPKGGEVWIDNLHGANIMIYMKVQSN